MGCRTQFWQFWKERAERQNQSGDRQSVSTETGDFNEKWDVIARGPLQDNGIVLQLVNETDNESNFWPEH